MLEEKALFEPQLSEIPWVEKYRPQDLQKIVTQQDTINTIMKFVDDGIIPHMLFYGPSGIGKTTTILALVHELKKSKNLISIELNSSEQRGIGTIREKIQNFAKSKHLYNNGSKMIILDEVDAMTKNAQTALKKIIDLYSNNVSFCLIGNYINNIIMSLRSRCMCLKFMPIDKKSSKDILESIIKNENIEISEKALDYIVDNSDGDLRKCINVLQSVSITNKKIECNDIYQLINVPYQEQIENILTILQKETFKNAYNKLNNIIQENNINLNSIIDGIHSKIITLKLEDEYLIYILSKLSELEYNLANDTDYNIQLSLLISIFQKKR